MPFTTAPWRTAESLHVHGQLKLREPGLRKDGVLLRAGAQLPIESTLEAGHLQQGREPVIPAACRELHCVRPDLLQTLQVVSFC